MDKKNQEARLKQQIRREDQVFKRRKEGIKKKALELATLCDVPVCLIIQSPDGEFEVWPENPNEVTIMLDNYYKKKSHVSQSKNVTQISGKLPSETGRVNHANSNKDFASENHGLNNDRSADKNLDEFCGQNWCDAGASQNLEKISNGQNCLKGKEKAEENCCQVKAMNDNWKQSLRPLGLPEKVYDLPPLEVFDPSLQLVPANFHGNFASSSNTDFSLYGEENWQLPPCDDPSLWSLPHQEVMLPVQEKFPVGTKPESSHHLILGILVSNFLQHGMDALL